MVSAAVFDCKLNGDAMRFAVLLAEWFFFFSCIFVGSNIEFLLDKIGQYWFNSLRSIGGH